MAFGPRTPLVRHTTHNVPQMLKAVYVRGARLAMHCTRLTAFCWPQNEAWCCLSFWKPNPALPTCCARSGTEGIVAGRHSALSSRVSLMSSRGDRKLVFLAPLPSPDHNRWSSLLISFKDTSSEHAYRLLTVVDIQPWYFDDVC